MNNKAYMILDMPGLCENCRFHIKAGEKHLCYIKNKTHKQDKPEWCPINYFPKKKVGCELPAAWIQGYNQCLDDIFEVNNFRQEEHFYLEIPCPVGATVYILWENLDVTESKVDGYKIEDNSIKLLCNGIWTDITEIGKTIFTSKESLIAFIKNIGLN